MIERLFDSFLINHFSSAERFDGLVMWTICTCFIWTLQIKKSDVAIKGMQGSNLFWEGHEQVIYWSLTAMWPIVFKAAFISNVPIEVWYFIGFLMGFSLLGRSILDYALAFFGRSPVNQQTEEQGPIKVVEKKTTESTTETTVEPK